MIIKEALYSELNQKDISKHVYTSTPDRYANKTQDITKNFIYVDEYKLPV